MPRTSSVSEFHITVGIIQKMSKAYARSLVFLVSPSDLGLPLALKAVRSKLSPRVRGKCLQPPYKVASRC